jgi:hypothetical protein
LIPGIEIRARRQAIAKVGIPRTYEREVVIGIL